MGWPSLVEEVARVWDGLPPGQRAYAVIITSDYGEAGAIQRFGPALGLPTPYSGHNSYWWWATPPAGTTTVVFVGYPNDDELRRFFATVGSPGSIGNPYGLENDEYDQPVWIVADPREPLPATWPQWRHYD